LQFLVLLAQIWIQSAPFVEMVLVISEHMILDRFHCVGLEAQRTRKFLDFFFSCRFSAVMLCHVILE
jgi:hypothetical protein